MHNIVYPVLHGSLEKEILTAAVDILYYTQ